MPNTLSTFHQSRLPHVTPAGGNFFITFRLADALPQPLIKAMTVAYRKEAKRICRLGLSSTEKRKLITNARSEYFGQFDHQLDQKPFGGCVLQNSECARLLIEQISRYDGDLYDLQAYCVMPNHVHLLINLARQLTDSDDFYLHEEELSLTYVPLCEIMRRIKGASARYINLYLGRSGPLWQKDSYDHWIRHNEKWANFYYYILNNPIKAGLVGEGEVWPYSFGKYECTDL